MTEKRIPMRLWYRKSAPCGQDFIAAWDRTNDPMNGWEKWSLPIGNGDMGVNVFGRTETERLQITEKSLENYGHWGFPGDFLLYGGHSDEVAGEFGPDAKSNPSKKGVGDVENRGASSCAHIYGKRLAWAESFTSARREFARAPMDLKLSADRFSSDGEAAIAFHAAARLSVFRPNASDWRTAASSVALSNAA